MSLTAIAPIETEQAENRVITPTNLRGNGVAATERRAIWAGVSKQITDGNHNAAEILKIAELDWTVSAQSIRPFSDKGKMGKTIPGYKAIIRNDNGETLSVMSDAYQVVQNTDALSFADEVFGANGEQGYYESAGMLRGGRKVFINCLLPQTMFVNGDTQDKIEQRVLVATSHDGSVPLILKLVSLRVVCQNTFTAALKEHSNEIKIRHTQNLEMRVKQAQVSLGLISGYVDDLQGVINQLATSKFSQDNMAEFGKKLLRVKENDKGKIPTRSVNNLDKLVWLFANGTGNVGATRWDALNAVTEYTDHERTGKGSDDTERASNRAESVLFGQSAATKQEALELLLN